MLNFGCGWHPPDACELGLLKLHVNNFLFFPVSSVTFSEANVHRCIYFKIGALKNYRIIWIEQFRWLFLYFLKVINQSFRNLVMTSWHFFFSTRFGCIIWFIKSRTRLFINLSSIVGCSKWLRLGVPIKLKNDMLYHTNNTFQSTASEISFDVLLMKLGMKEFLKYRDLQETELKELLWRRKLLIGGSRS